MKKNKDLRQTFRHFPRPHLILLSGLLILFALSQLFLNHSDEQKKTPVVKIIEHPEPVHPKIEDTWRWHAEKVLNGDSLSQIFKRLNVSAAVLDKILSSDEQAKALTNLYPGHELHFAFDNDNKLVALQYTPSKLESLNITLNPDDSFKLEYTVKKAETHVVYHKAVVESSLFLDAKKAGISQNITLQIANIFSGVIDFVKDTHKGDTFDALYEETYVDNEKIGDGKLLAISYTTSDETFTAYRYEFKDGSSGYFNPQGLSMRKTFLRAPLDFIRVSSEYGLRLHPLHKKMKAHQGIDYSAPQGTPVYAAGNGTVIKAGFSPANGNFVIIQHTSQYTTKYLHFFKRFARTGQRVKQGDVIGQVGSTGYATGPHLHYEFLLNGVHRNPRDIAKLLPPADPIPAKDKKRFAEQVALIKAEYQKRQTANSNR